MTNMRISSLGYIKGGSCDKEHVERAARVNGAWDIWDHMLRYGYVKKAKNGKFKIIKDLDKGWRWFAKRFSGYDNTGMHEIGALRFSQDLLPLIGKRWFDKKSLGGWIDVICGASSSIGVIEDPDGFMGSGLTLGNIFPPHTDDIYQERLKRGDFGDTPKYKGKIFKPLD